MMQIFYKKENLHGEKYYKILKIKGISKSKSLPLEYVSKEDRIFLCQHKICAFKGNLCYFEIGRNDLLNEEDFINYMNFILSCGKRLAKIKNLIRTNYEK